MKKLLAVFVLFFALKGFSQPIVGRANGSITVQDYRFYPKFNMVLPTFADTASANLNLGLNLAGAMIYTQTDAKAWLRKGIGGTAGIFWEEIGGGGGGITASNGLTKVVSDIRLGGPLTQFTNVALNTNPFQIDGTLDGQFVHNFDMGNNSGDEINISVRDVATTATEGGRLILSGAPNMTASLFTRSLAGNIVTSSYTNNEAAWMKANRTVELIPTTSYISVYPDSISLWKANRTSQILLKNKFSDQWADSALIWRISDGSAQFRLDAGVSEIYGGSSEISVSNAGGIALKPYLGRLYIDTLTRSSSSDDSVLVKDAANNGLIKLRSQSDIASTYNPGLQGVMSFNNQLGAGFYNNTDLNNGTWQIGESAGYGAGKGVLIDMANGIISILGTSGAQHLQIKTGGVVSGQIILQNATANGLKNYIADSIIIGKLQGYNKTRMKITPDSIFIKNLPSIGVAAQSNLMIIDSMNGQIRMMPRGALGSSNFTFNDSLRWVSVIAYGADRTGVSNSSAAFAAAIATGLTVYVPPGRYFLQTGVTLNVNQTIFGEYGQSVIYTNQTTCDMITATDSCTVANLSFYGTGQGTLPGGVFTLQNGVRMNGNAALVDGCIFKSIDGSGAYAFPASGSKLFNRVSNCYMEDCTIGFFDVLNSEYMTIENTIAYSCVLGFWDRSAGNNRYIDVTGHSCTDGFRLTTGGNGDHGTVIGSFNHCTNNLNVQSCTVGMIFTGCNFFSGNILIGSVGNANKVIISESAIGTATITPTTTTNCVIRDNYFLTVTESAAAGTVYVNNVGSTTSQQYATTGGNTFGATQTYGTNDAFTLALETNNVARLQISSAGDVGIGTAPAAGNKIFIVTPTASAGVQAILMRNSSVQNILQVQESGRALIGNQTSLTAPINLFGPTFIGNSTTPTAMLHIIAGTTGPSTAPLKFTTGTSMTAAEAGAVEFTTDDLFFTITTGTARKRFTFADPVGGLTSGRVPFATTNGRLTDDAGYTYSTSTGLVGAGIVSTAAFGANITSVSTTTTLDGTHYTVLVDATAGAVTINLPAANTATRRIYCVKKIDASANNVVIDGSGAETIDGAATQTITTQWSSFTIQSNSTAWFIL